MSIAIFIKAIFFKCAAILIISYQGSYATGDGCSYPGVPANGNVRLTNYNFSTGAFVSYNCIGDFTLYGDSTRICKEGKWINPIPNCGYDVALKKQVAQYRKVDPSFQSFVKPEYIVDGNMQTCSRAYQDRKECWTEIYLQKIYNVFGFNITIQKNNGFSLAFYVGNSTNKTDLSLCLSTGVTKPLNTKNNLFLKCNNDVRGDMVRVVDEREASAYVEICEIEVIASDDTCGTPDAPINGRIKMHRHNNSAEFLCNFGYLISGSRFIKCINGKWETTKTRCEEPKCKLPIDFKNGLATVLRTEKGNVASFRCDKYFHLRGNSELSCLENGQWNESFPECLSINVCSPPAIPSNGSIIKLSGTFVEFACNMGFYLSGNKISNCVNGDWQSETPLCNELICPMPMPFNNGSVEVTITEIGKTARFTCDQPNYLEGNFELQCTESGQWNRPIPQCLRDNSTDIIAEKLNATWPYYEVIAAGAVLGILILVLITVLVYKQRRLRRLVRKSRMNSPIGENNVYQTPDTGKGSDKAMGSADFYQFDDSHYLQPIDKNAALQQEEENFYESIN